MFFTSNAGARQPVAAPQDLRSQERSVQQMKENIAQMKACGEPDVVTTLLNPLVPSESMDVYNDPRFFTDSVIDKRLNAFTSLSVVSGIVMYTAMDECFSMKKDMDFNTVAGWFQLVGLFCMTAVLFVNAAATYVIMAQTYFTYRLMTAGPTGFEMATSFYLNPNMSFWRHFSVKGMLLSLPVFLFGEAFRIFVRIDKDMPRVGVDSSTAAPSAVVALDGFRSRVFGVSWLAIFCFVCWTGWSLIILYVNHKHIGVFKERYDIARACERPVMNSVRAIAERHHFGSGFDV